MTIFPMLTISSSFSRQVSHIPSSHISTYGTCEKISHCFRFLLFSGIHVIIPSCDLIHWNLPSGVSNTICHIHTLWHTFTHAYSVWIHIQTFYRNAVFITHTHTHITYYTHIPLSVTHRDQAVL